MRDPYYRDTTATLYAANPRDVLAEMPDQAVDCIVTSPPPWTPPQHPGSDDASDEHGHEPTPALYVAALRRVLTEAHRVLTDEGTCWLVASDRYATDTGWNAPTAGRHTRRVRDQPMRGIPAVSLIGLPWQIAFAAQDDGWIIRNAIVWHHPAIDDEPDSEPAADQLTSSYELIFLLVKQKRYHFDLDPIRQPQRRPDVAANPPTVGGNQGAAGCIDASARRRPGNRHRAERHSSGKYTNAAGMCRRPGAAMLPTGHHHAAAHPNGKNPGDVWTLPAPPLWNTMPIEVPLRCIAAGCRPGGTVLDMFAGIATTGLAARELDRSFIGIEQTPDLCRIAQHRLEDNTGDPDGSA